MLSSKTNGQMRKQVPSSYSVYALFVDRFLRNRYIEDWDKNQILENVRQREIFWKMTRNSTDQ